VLLGNEHRAAIRDAVNFSIEDKKTSDVTFVGEAAGAAPLFVPGAESDLGRLPEAVRRPQ
jgi:hypothetical protein